MAMELLSSLDGVFLAVEDARNQMNIGTLAIFEGPTPSTEEVRRFLADRMALVPRCRQRLRLPSGPFGRPVWIDDAGFDLGRHVRAVSLVDRGGAGVDDLVADLVVVPLDRRHPLWEVWVVDGIGDGRWAMLAKVHHCMVDGIAGTNLLGAILAPEPEVPAPPSEPWAPGPEPSPAAFTWFNVRAGLGSLCAHLRGAAAALGHPRRSWTRARQVVIAAKRLWYRQHHVDTSLVGPIGTERRWAHLVVSFDDIRAVRAGLGGTVNDVVLAAVTGGFRELLAGRGEPIDGRTITAMVPVSLRSEAQRGAAGNLVANVHALLPVGQDDPRSVLREVHEQVDELTSSHEVEATGLLMRIGDFVPRLVAERVARAVLHRQRNVETVITDVPGPRTPLYLGPHRMLAGYPVAPIGGRVRITVAVWSYCDQLYIGITGDRASASDVDELARGIGRGFDRLLAAA